MAPHRKRKCHSRATRTAQRRCGNSGIVGHVHYRQLRELAESGDFAGAQSIVLSLQAGVTNIRDRAILESDLGALAAAQGKIPIALRQFQQALLLDSNCEPARKNLAFLDTLEMTPRPRETRSVPPVQPDGRPIRVAILSLLFNWPSTGGGTVHTAETGKFLLRTGYEVQHIYACYPEWGLGKVSEPTGVPSVPLSFTEPCWNAPTIRRRFREAVDAFGPDYVIVTDSWNTKPLLAEAVSGYRYFLRLAALECLCPLNNVRLLYSEERGITACPRQQLATPEICRQCVAQRAQQSGSLHQADRSLGGFDASDYPERLRHVFAEAEGVLVVNPLIATMVAPFAKAVHVIPSGFDRERFPWLAVEKSAPQRGRVHRLFFAGLVDEGMKGFSVLQAAGALLWRRRQDFEIVATADPAGRVSPFLRYIGWQSQENLPKQIREADILIFPTIAEEALGRSAVEAMGCGIPVIASRIGGLSFTVTDGLTGLLFEPGNAADLAAKIETLLDDAELRRRMGKAGRARFEREFTWDVIIEQHYRRLLAPNSAAPESAPVRRADPPEFQPSFIETVDRNRLLREAADFFQLPLAEAERMFETYRKYSEAQGYARTLGELKTLTLEESFLLMLLLSLTRPPVIVEIGTHTGRSTRRIVDLVGFLGLDARVVCYDVVNQLQHVNPEEVDFHQRDLTGSFRADLLDQYPGGMIFVDTHSYALLSEIVQESAEHFGNWSLAIHDAGRGLCNSRMTIARESEVTSATGVWERHVLAAAFGVDDPLSPVLDACSTPLRKLRIFDTQHGVALIVPAALTGEQARPTDEGPLLVGQNPQDERINAGV